MDRDFFESLFESLPFMIHIRDSIGTIIYVNSAFATFFDIEKERMIGKNVSFLDTYIHKNDDLINSDRYVLENSRDKIVLEERIKLIGGKEAWLETTKTNFYYQGKHYSVYTSEDIDKRKSNQENSKRRQVDMSKLNSLLKERVAKELERNREKDHILIQQSKLAAMGEMIGNIAHQWRQPLNALSLLFAKIDRYYDKNMLTREELDGIVHRATSLIHQMSSTIDDFRNFYVPNRKKERFSINAKIESALKLMEVALLSNTITIEREFGEEMHGFGFPNEFSQVVLNILSNAKDAIIASGKFEKYIVIRTYTREEHIFIEVEDSGTGIKEEILPKIFEPYFTTKEEINGTGIGLYMSKKIIEDNFGGKISALNGTNGAKFLITLDRYTNL